MRITGDIVHSPTVEAAPPYSRCEEGRTEEPQDHGDEHPNHYASGRPQLTNKKFSLIHNHLDNHRSVHNHEHQEQNSGKDAPGRTKDEVARSRANKAPESEEMSVEFPNQIT